MNYFVSLLLLLCAALINAQSSDYSMKVDAGKEFFTVSLPANPTTGFQWSVTKYDKKLFQLTSSQFQKPSQQLMGAGGHMLFTFKVMPYKKYPKTSTIVFKYARSWDATDTTIKNVVIRFR